jgi:heme/copper-type cytochrome/quinol oxidase subunit 3
MPDGPVSALGMSTTIGTLTLRARQINRREKGLPLILVADAALFFVLISTYLVARTASPTWPRPLHFPSGLMTVAMIMFALAASGTMRVAVQYAREKDFAMAQRMVALAIVGWSTFLFLLAMEWARLYFFEHVQLLSNPWHVAALGISYYGITGILAAHVMAGTVWLIAASQRVGEWRLVSLEIFVDYVNAVFLIVAFLLIFSSMDLGGF